MSYGHAGTILYVDLTSRAVWREPLAPERVADFLGARGINARLLWESLSPGVDPLGPENALVFGAGALTGSHAPSSGRTTLTCKSPATGRYLKTNAGGHWGARLKYAGYDHLVIRGRAESPVYLFVDDDRVELRDASSLWGLTVPEADRALRRQLGVAGLEVAAIGPAGENRVRFASVMLSVGSALGRGGAGAVMGAKNLKAIAVRGTGALRVADPDRFHRLAMEARERLAKDPVVQGLHAFGTASFVEAVNAAGAFPSFNFRAGSIEGAEKVSGQQLVASALLRGRAGCSSCAVNCHRVSALRAGAYQGCRTFGPEYESISALGPGCGVVDLEAIVKASSLCNDYGLDTISAGGVVQWAMESLERGALTRDDLDGFDLAWGNAPALLAMIRKIALREGCGDLLAEGTKVCAERIGKGSDAWAVQANGLEQSRCETRFSKGYALGFAVNPRGPDHLTTQVIAEFGMGPEAIGLVRSITGDEQYANPTRVEKRAELVRWHEDCYAATDSLGLCSFATTLSYAVTPARMADLFSAATGQELTETELLTAGRRIVTLERVINVREGFSRRDDKLPHRLVHESLGPFRNSDDEMAGMLDEYFRLHGWEVESGRPTPETLSLLGLGDVVPALLAVGGA